jgi:hypothetical protein
MSDAPKDNGKSTHARRFVAPAHCRPAATHRRLLTGQDCSYQTIAWLAKEAELDASQFIAPLIGHSQRARPRPVVPCDGDVMKPKSCGYVYDERHGHPR